MTFQLAVIFRFACQFLMLSLTALHFFEAAAAQREDANVTLNAGDILLVPLNCYVCNAIEKETGVPYSHSVVVASTTNKLNEAIVYEAWGEVKRTPLSEIFKRAQKGERLFHLRPIEFRQGNISESDISAVFKEKFEGLPFDDEFLWNNADTADKEKLYCSEFVIKFINTFLQNPEPPVPMSFTTLQDFWKKYYSQFDQEVPEGELGISPATIYRSNRFEKRGPLKTPLFN